MYAYEKQNNNNIIKYEIYFDKEKLEDLKQRIIDNTALIKHEKTTAINPYSIKDTLDYEICNLTYKELVPIDRFDHYEREYFVEYDKIIYPNLVKIIYSFLRNEVSALKELSEYSIEYPTKYLEEEIAKVNNEINNILNTDFELKRKKLDELQSLVIDAENNKNKTNTKLYYEELKSLIQAKYIDEIDLEVLNHATKFLNASKVRYLNKLNVAKDN